jgi:hypothetical protein
MSPSHDWKWSVDDVVMAVAVYHIYTEMARLRIADLVALMAIVFT